MDADELVQAWAFENYKNKYCLFNSTAYFHNYNHLIACETTVITPVSFGWECGCYSEYTRDDDFYTTFMISCDCGVSDPHNFGTSDWNLPDILRELAEYEDTQNCPYWEDE